MVAAGSPVPAVNASARRKVASYFLAHDAVRSNDAVRFETRSPIQRRMFERMLDAGIIRTGGNHTYFLDVVEYERVNHRRRKRVFTAVGAAVGLAVVIGLLR